MLLAIIDDVFRQLKEIMPEVNSVYIRSDNAGCYHCAFSLLSVYHVACEHAIELKRFDFSDPQGGKGSCDRKAATIKSHMRTHLNKPKQKPVLEEVPQNRENSDDDESCNDKGSDLFFCPEEGCVKSFVQYKYREILQNEPPTDREQPVLLL